MLWQAKRRIETEYQRALSNLLESCAMSFFTASSVSEYLAVIRKYAQIQVFNDYANALSMKMIISLFDDVGRTWRQAARGNSQGRLIYDLLVKDLSGHRKKELDYLIHSNAELIRTLPSSVADTVVDYISREVQKGRRHEDIAREIKNLFPRRTHARAKLIERTECAKTHTALLQSDCDVIGVDWYFWHSTHDQRTRDAHSKMNGILCNWHDLPNPEALFPVRGIKPYGNYPPGGTFNCRCYAEPLVSGGQLTKNSYKVHVNGKIIRMNKVQLMKLI